MPLAHDIFIALMDDRVVILDAAADRYRLIVGRKAAALLALATDRPVTDDVALGALLAEGVLIAPTNEAIRSAFILTARRSAIEMPAREGDAISVASASHTLATVMFRQRLGGFASVLRWVARLKRGMPPAISSDIIACAQSYDRVRARFPVERICLRDSLALYALMLRRGMACNLVLGVRLDPFGAHAWVQSDDIILSDTLWSARPMQPILVL